MCTKSELKAATEELVKAAVAISPSVYKILLFGSYARGENTEESDVDIMILMDCPADEIKVLRKEISKAASRIGLKHDLLLAVLLRNKDEFKDKEEYLPFYKNVIAEGVELYGRTA